MTTKDILDTESKINKLRGLIYGQIIYGNKNAPIRDVSSLIYDYIRMNEKLHKLKDKLIQDKNCQSNKPDAHKDEIIKQLKLELHQKKISEEGVDRHSAHTQQKSHLQDKTLKKIKPSLVDLNNNLVYFQNQIDSILKDLN